MKHYPIDLKNHKYLLAFLNQSQPSSHSPNYSPSSSNPHSLRLAPMAWPWHLLRGGAKQQPAPPKGNPVPIATNHEVHTYTYATCATYATYASYVCIYIYILLLLLLLSLLLLLLLLLLSLVLLLLLFVFHCCCYYYYYCIYSTYTTCI